MEVSKEKKKKKKKKKKKTKKTKKNLGQGQVEGVTSEKIGQGQGSSCKEFVADIKKAPPESNPSLYSHLPMDAHGDIKSRTSLIIKVDGPLSKEHQDRHLEGQMIWEQFKKEKALKINKIKAMCDKGTQWESYCMDAAVSTEDLKIEKGKIMYARVPTYSDIVKTPQKFPTYSKFKKIYGGKAGPFKEVVDGYSRVSRSRSSKCELCKPTKSVCGCLGSRVEANSTPAS
jgi:hypothetical protein